MKYLYTFDIWCRYCVLCIGIVCRVSDPWFKLALCSKPSCAMNMFFKANDAAGVVHCLVSVHR